MELSSIPPRPGTRRAKKKYAASQFIFLFGICQFFAPLVIGYGVRAELFKDALVRGLISLAVYMIIACLLAWYERKKAAGAKDFLASS